jgi:hypothetical protein
MPFEIFLIPGLIFGIFGFYRGLKKRDQYEETLEKKF